MAFKVEMTNKKIAFIQKKEKNCNFCGMLTLFIMNAFFKVGSTPHKAKQPLKGMRLKEKEVQKDAALALIFFF